MPKRKPFGGKKFKKGKIVLDVGGKGPADVNKQLWQKAKKQKLW